MIDFYIKVKQQQAQNLPFVLYRKPNDIKLAGFFQNNDHLYFAENFEESGFVFAPFEGSQMILIPKKESVKWETLITSSADSTFSDFKESEDRQAKEHFEKLVQKGIDAIANGILKKVVLSRKEIVGLSGFDLVSIFEKLIQSYPTAFCYCWFHPKIGLWMGATPERLLKATNKKFSTMALAGTQKLEGTAEVIWEKKEMEEQQFVTDFIINNLKDLSSEVSVSSPYTIQAGTLAHIKTDIEGVIKENSSLKQIVSVLHPTPAVCGLPKDAAKAFILENEGYEREYYTGFLGELNKEGFNKEELKTDLYVNLRCMQIKMGAELAMTQAHLYMGCGITVDSIPEKEWRESVNKSATMKKILDLEQ
ncbi:chorismate-binding protein [Flavobacterium xinjiangense]|uniref:isochorismate synthase n=1 Tax=Flavobacterium xinjiangense TaxID=178356 RepID=A0A1M7K5C8_9FLAO|nr:chorismate-binding protein [Flavobacterium xinjiangense]SHM60391.1 isochorismate synthase [Flavobacterium xinjiangense]